MEEIKVEANCVICRTSGNRFYPSWAFIVGPLVGGPLVGFYFLSKNYNLIGQKKLATNSLITGTFLLLLQGLLVFLPEVVIDYIPTSLPIIYTVYIYHCYKKYQEKMVSNYMTNGVVSYSVLNILGFSIISLMITVCFFIFLFFFSEMLYVIWTR